MHARFRSEPAVAIVTDNVHGRTFDARDLTGRCLDHISFEPMRLRPAQVHAQQHFGPVLGFCAASARLNIEVGAIGIHLAAEHAPELKPADGLLESAQIADDLIDGIAVILVNSQRKQFFCVGESRCQLVETQDHLLQQGTLLPQRLGPLGLIPDIRLLEFALNFGQPFRLGVIVKDTSSTHRCVQ